jgi:hypothetical protein
MPDGPSTPPPALPPGGQITRVSVTYTVNTEEGRYHAIHGLKMMRKHARPVLVHDLVYDLAVICEDVLAAPPSMASLPNNVARLAFERRPARRKAYQDLLAAACDILDCPPPAGPAGEPAFLRLRSERAGLLVAALRPVLGDPVPGPVELTEAAARLRAAIAARPADGYLHSPLSL